MCFPSQLTLTQELTLRRLCSAFMEITFARRDLMGVSGPQRLLPSNAVKRSGVVRLIRAVAPPATKPLLGSLLPDDK